MIVEVNNQPLVSVPVITYNSAKFVLETLESIKAQTYQNIELIISDDCSTDNTVELCQQWVEQNKNRFVRTQIITSEVNTGVSANGNRGRDACQGEWIKGIAGDDLLMPNCIADCVEYVQQHPNVIYLFGRIEAFGACEETNMRFTNNVDYSFFDLDVDGQLKYLVFNDNCIKAPACFYNRYKVVELGIRNDERIPLLEDWPKWINIVEKGIPLKFIDKVLVLYRIHNDSLSTSYRASAKFIESNYLFDLYYRYPRWQTYCSDYAADRMTKSYINLYNDLLACERNFRSILNSRSYKLGKFLLTPIRKVRLWINNEKNIRHLLKK